MPLEIASALTDLSFIFIAQITPLHNLAHLVPVITLLDSNFLSYYYRFNLQNAIGCNTALLEFVLTLWAQQLNIIQGTEAGLFFLDLDIGS